MRRSEKLKLLAQDPIIVEQVLSEIPKEILKRRCINGKWSIHKYASDLTEAQKMMPDRFKSYKTVKNPVFKPCLPGVSEAPQGYLLAMNLNEFLEQLISDRVVMVDYLEKFTEKDWLKEVLYPKSRNSKPKFFEAYLHAYSPANV